MEKLYEFLRGTARIEARGAQPEKFMNALANRGIEFWNCDPGDGFAMRMTIYAGNLKTAEALAAGSMCELSVLGERGGTKVARSILRRRVLAVCLVLFAALTGWSSLYIWDFDVTGNKTVTDGEILRALEDAGVGVGAFWPGISNDMLRAQVLPRLHDISWLAVEVKSSRAVVKVRERVEKPELRDGAPQNVAAAKTGIIQKLSVLQGKPLLSPGQAVLKGETIVSGAMDSIDGGTRKVHAMAEAEALTMYELTAVCPLREQKKTARGLPRSRFALIIGKNRINFYPGSRNEPACCDKIIRISRLSVKGVFTLPLALVRETFTGYELSEAAASPQARLKKDLTNTLRRTLAPGGETLKTSFSAADASGLAVSTLTAECRENIALAVPMTRQEQDEIDFANLNSKEGKDE